MNKLLTLRKRFAELVEEEEKLLNSLIEESRDPSADEEKRLAEIDSSKKTTVALIERATRIEEDRANVSADEENRAAGTPAAQPRITMGRQDGENERGQYVPFASIGEQLQVVRRAADSPHSLDKRLAEMNKRAAAGLQGAVGADGGFLLQVDFSADLMQNAIETGLLASRCRRFPVSPGATGIEFPVVEETSRVDGSRYGGVQVYWAAEAEAATKTKPKFSIERLTFQKLLGMCVVTDEMLKDAAFLGSFIGQAFSEEFAYKIDDGIVRGTGSGQMLGILNAGCLVSVAKETSQVADTIVGENVLKMRGRQLSRSRANSVWLINQDCEPQVHTLSIVKSKSDVPLYNPADGLNRPLDSIMGRPVVTIEQASTVGDKGDIILADLSYYALITQDFEQASSVHVYFDTQQTAFRFSMRINGQPMMKSALTPARGSNTLSPFIVLDDRA